MLAHKENPQTLFLRDSKAMTMKVGIGFGVCNNPPTDLLQMYTTSGDSPSS